MSEMVRWRRGALVDGPSELVILLGELVASASSSQGKLSAIQNARTPLKPLEVMGMESSFPCLAMWYCTSCMEVGTGMICMTAQK